MAVRLLAPDPKPVEHVIGFGKFKGCTLFVRRPSYEDQLTAFLGDDPNARAKARLRLIEGWKGVDADPSPFIDDKGGPVGFSEPAFELACRVHPELLTHSMLALAKVIGDEDDEKKFDGPSQDFEPDGQSQTPSPSTP